MSFKHRLSATRLAIRSIRMSWFTRSMNFSSGMPNLRTPPPSLGISTRLTGLGVQVPLSSRSRWVGQCSFRYPGGSSTVIPSMPGPPLFDRTRLNLIPCGNRSGLRHDVPMPSMSSADFCDAVISEAMNAGFADFEDAVQYHAALAAKVPVFVTRNVRHYRKSAIRVCTAEEYLALTGA